MTNLNQLKQGGSIPLNDQYQITLITKRDLPDITAMLNTPEVGTYLFYAPSPSREYTGYFDPIVENCEKALREGIWPKNPNIIVRDAKQSFMGMGGLEADEMLSGNFEVGYQLPVHAWRKGIATAVCTFLTQFAFNELGAHKITADCIEGNVGSYKTLEKCGYRREGHQADFYKLEDGFDGRFLYGMTLNQFQNLSAELPNA
ncbi:MAG: GNAT family protein [Chloroflexota bacterium]